MSLDSGRKLEYLDRILAKSWEKQCCQLILFSESSALQQLFFRKATGNKSSISGALFLVTFGDLDVKPRFVLLTFLRNRATFLPPSMLVRADVYTPVSSLEINCAVCIVVLNIVNIFILSLPRYFSLIQPFSVHCDDMCMTYYAN